MGVLGSQHVLIEANDPISLRSSHFLPSSLLTNPDPSALITQNHHKDTRSVDKTSTSPSTSGGWYRKGSQLGEWKNFQAMLVMTDKGTASLKAEGGLGL